VVIPPPSSCGSEPSSSPDLMLLVSDVGSAAGQPHTPTKQGESSKPHIIITSSSSPVQDSRSMCDLKSGGTCEGTPGAWFSSSSSSSSSPGDSSRRQDSSSSSPKAATTTAGTAAEAGRYATTEGATSSPAGGPAGTPAPGGPLGSAVSACLLLAGVFGAVQVRLTPKCFPHHGCCEGTQCSAMAYSCAVCAVTVVIVWWCCCPAGSSE
jgi:hypothetical protein